MFLHYRTDRTDYRLKRSYLFVCLFSKLPGKFLSYKAATITKEKKQKIQQTSLQFGLCYQIVYL